MTITEAFVLPSPQDIRALEFVVRLREAEPSSDEVARLVRDYVITPAVGKELPRILDDMKQVYDRGEEYGRFIHGSFGSGKSHFMTMLSLLLEGAEPARQKFAGLFQAHAESQRSQGREAADHAAWLAKANLLVVRIHMLSVRGRSTGFDRAVYDGFNQALKRRGKEPFEFLHVESIFDEVRREAESYGDVVWKQLETQGILGGRQDFEAIAAGTPQARERFARAWLQYKGRKADEAGIDPRWSEGLRGLAEHARAQGYGGVVLMIDEFLLWLSEKTGQEFSQEVNSLNVVVDHNTGQRAAPIFVFVARQRNLQEFFPDLVDETKIHEHIDHHSKRFEVTSLQDVELRHIVKGRVLRPRQPEAIQEAVRALSEKNQKILPALLAGADLEYLKDVYPFHPALIEMLVDVTSLMQRERSALRLLYELLVIHYPQLPLGEFLPVGSAFAAIFPEAGVEASKKVEQMQEIHQQYYQRLRPALDKMADANSDLNEERHRALDQLVKTVLLAEVSPRLKQGGLTIERLVQLNSVDVEGETFRGQVRVAETDLLALSQDVPDLQIAGTGKTALVRYVLGRVSLGEVLARARSKVDNSAQRFKVFWPALRKALKIADRRGFQEGGPNTGEWELSWRHTRRQGTLKLTNVRELPYDDFEVGPADFKILVDYPWDEPGQGVDQDRLRAKNANKKLGTCYTVCWLPRHMSPNELGVMTELAAVRFLRSEAGQEDLLETLSSQDRSKLLEQAHIREENLAGQLDELLKEVYIRHGEFLALVSHIDVSRPRDTLAENLEHIATLLMDRRHPQHPHFLVEPKKADLETLLSWMVSAGESTVSVAYDDNTGRVLRSLGQPLELVNQGQTKASLRLDSRFIKDVLQQAEPQAVSWAPIAERLRDTYGLQPLVIDLFLCFLCQRDHRAVNEVSGDPMEVKLGMSPSLRLRLQRGKLVSPADWHRLRDLGDHLFGLKRPSASRSLQGQDRFAGELRQAGGGRREALQGLYQRLVKLGVEESPRLKELALCNERLAPLAHMNMDSHQVLTDLLAQWPDDSSDPLRPLVREAASLREALLRLSESSKHNLEAGKNHPLVGVDVRAHLEDLNALLGGPQAEQPLSEPLLEEWNRRAQELIQRLIERAEPEPGPEPKSPAKTAVRPRAVLVTTQVDAGDGDAVSAFLAEVRKAIQAVGQGKIQLSLVREEDAP